MLLVPTTAAEPMPVPISNSSALMAGNASYTSVDDLSLVPKHRSFLLDQFPDLAVVPTGDSASERLGTPFTGLPHTGFADGSGDPSEIFQNQYGTRFCPSAELFSDGMGER